MTTITFKSCHALIEPEIPQHWEDRDGIKRELDEILVRWNHHLDMMRFKPSVAKTARSQFFKSISDPQYESDLRQGQQFATDMAKVLKLDMNIIHRVNTIVAAKYNLPYSLYVIGENNEANIIVIVTARIGQLIPLNLSLLRTLNRPTALDTAALRASLLMAPTSTDYISFLRVSSQPWANAILELLQLEIKLSDTLQAAYSINASYKRRCMRCLRQISSAYEVLPPSFLIHASDVVREGSNPICGGGFADIWKGRMDEHDVCLKVLRFFTTARHLRRKLLQDVCREALVWKQLDHPGVLKFLGVSMDMFAPSFCLVSPWMDNGNINEYLQVYPDHDCLTVLREVAEAMQYLHEFTPCIVHADIRGANIMVTNDGHCVLADFGLASVSETQSFATSSVGLKGSVRWLCPEVLLPTASQQKPHPSRDIYAYGCTALEIYTKRPPFHSYYHDAMIFTDLIAGKRPERPTQEEAPCLTNNVWQLIEQCWRQDASTRPQAREIASELINLIQRRFADEMAQDGGLVRKQASSSQTPVRQHKTTRGFQPRTSTIVPPVMTLDCVTLDEPHLKLVDSPLEIPPPQPESVPGRSPKKETRHQLKNRHTPEPGLRQQARQRTQLSRNCEFSTIFAGAFSTAYQGL
ncbi:kinase-like domain-containing protein [Mycena floridula]|nr:kinase-like domain-containing protein [Mycena floridula]